MAISIVARLPRRCLLFAKKRRWKQQKLSEGAKLSVQELAKQWTWSLSDIIYIRYLSCSHARNASDSWDFLFMRRVFDVRQELSSSPEVWRWSVKSYIEWGLKRKKKRRKSPPYWLMGHHKSKWFRQHEKENLINESVWCRFVNVLYYVGVLAFHKIKPQIHRFRFVHTIWTQKVSLILKIKSHSWYLHFNPLYKLYIRTSTTHQGDRVTSQGKFPDLVHSRDIWNPYIPIGLSDKAYSKARKVPTRDVLYLDPFRIFLTNVWAK